MSKEERSIDAPREADEADRHKFLAPRLHGFVKSYETAFRRIRKIPEDFHQCRSSERRPRERRTLKVRKTLPGYSSPTDRAILILKLN
jgi:hypothetical protein